MTQSLTAMYDCTHGPKKDCAQCLNRELVEALEGLLKDHCDLVNSGDSGFWEVEEEEEVIAARAVLEKAKEAQG